MLMQSSVRQAGTSPAVLSSPGVGLIPTILLNAAGTLPDPAVSVPSAKAARPAALLRRFHEAKETAAHSVTVWGTGRPLREFLHVDDLADACVFLMKNYSASEHINIGTGKETSIAQFAETIRSVVGFEGAIEYDATRPEDRKSTRLNSSH